MVELEDFFEQARKRVREVDNQPAPKQQVVVAFSYRQFLAYCQGHAVYPRDGKRACYADGPDALRGYHWDNIELVLLDGWWYRSDAVEINVEITVLTARHPNMTVRNAL